MKMLKLFKEACRFASFCFVVAAQSINPVVAESDSHDRGGQSGQQARGGGAEEERIALTSEQIAYSGISLAKAKLESVREVLPLYGQVVPNEQNVQSIAARFEGVVIRVNKQIGDPVRKGETLVEVESNDSLKTYSIKSAIDGVVTERNANVGEQTSNKTLFKVVDFSTVWVDLSAFPKDRAKVKLGQQAIIKCNAADVSGQGKVIYIAPFGSANQTTVVRVLLENPEFALVPGHFITAEIMQSEAPATVAIRSGAVQIVEDHTVVFVKGKEDFEVREVALGRTDGELHEVLSGLSVGESYVEKNSFVLKSEMGKEGAEHGH